MLIPLHRPMVDVPFPVRTSTECWLWLVDVIHFTRMSMAMCARLLWTGLRGQIRPSIARFEVAPRALSRHAYAETNIASRILGASPEL